MQFQKYQGTGNDFILLDDRAEQFDPADQPRIAALCHRRFGIGADGLILLRNRAGYDFEMVYFNADGFPTSLCGNGGRCTVAFAKFLGIIDNETNFLAVDGPHEARMEADGTVRLKMPDVAAPRPAPVHATLGDMYLHTGSPHHVRFLTEETHDEYDYDHPHLLEEMDVVGVGRNIRQDQVYDPAGVNVNFAEVPADPAQPWPVRTYERGVENETYSCGTGVTAVALAASQRGAKSPVQLSTPGGLLEVAFTVRPDGGFADVWLSGPATRVFSGGGGVVDWWGWWGDSSKCGWRGPLARAEVLWASGPRRRPGANGFYLALRWPRAPVVGQRPTALRHGPEARASRVCYFRSSNPPTPMTLRALEPDDLEFLYALENDRHIWGVSDTLAPVSRHALREYLAHATADFFEVRQLRLVLEAEGQAVGVVDLFGFEPLHQRAGVGITVLAAARQKGYARQALELLKIHARDVLRLHQIYATVGADNRASLALFRAAGFRRGGGAAGVAAGKRCRAVARRGGV